MVVVYRLLINSISIVAGELASTYSIVTAVSGLRRVNSIYLLPRLGRQYSYTNRLPVPFCVMERILPSLLHRVGSVIRTVVEFRFNGYNGNVSSAYGLPTKSSVVQTEELNIPLLGTPSPNVISNGNCTGGLLGSLSTNDTTILPGIIRSFWLIWFNFSVEILWLYTIRFLASTTFTKIGLASVLTVATKRSTLDVLPSATPPSPIVEIEPSNSSSTLTRKSFPGVSKKSVDVLVEANSILESLTGSTRGYSPSSGNVGSGVAIRSGILGLGSSNGTITTSTGGSANGP